jgi:transposase
MPASTGDALAAGQGQDHAPRPLPFRPRPAAGETTVPYVRRLARANHLRPGYLRRYLHDPGNPGQVRLDLLAILAGRDQAAVERALTATKPGPRPRPIARKQGKTALFTEIRQDAEQAGLSVRALADRHGVHRRTVRQALASPVPAPRKRPTGRTSKLDPFKDAIGTILQQEADNPDQPARTAKEIFEWLVAERGATQVSYSTVRNYVADRRTLRPRPRRTPTPPPSSASPPSASQPRRSTPMTMSPAHLAVEREDLSRLRDLLDAGHDVEDDNGDGWTLLRHAIDVEYDGHTQTGLAPARRRHRVPARTGRRPVAPAQRHTRRRRDRDPWALVGR